MPEYLVELYVPSPDDHALHEASRRARAAAAALTAEGTPVRHLRSILVPGDESCFVLYEACSAAAACEASRRAGLTVERLVEAVDDQPPEPARPSS